MRITPIKTPIVHTNDDLYALLNAALPPQLAERTVVVVTSKIVALCEGAVRPKHGEDRAEKWEHVKQEAEWYIDPHSSKYELMLTIKNQILAVNAGIDESNADHQYVLFPHRPYESARLIWEFLKKKYGLQQVGVLITDSRTFPLKWGQIGTCLAYCGFQPINNKIGQKDLFDHELKMTQVNVAEALAVASVLEMGEAAESQPLAVIEDIGMVEFSDVAPTATAIAALAIAPEDDAYAPILTRAEWLKGGGGE